MQPSVAIILVNYNGFDDTVECVKSLLKITYTNYSIYVVDNGSGDFTRIKEDPFLNENTTVICSNENLGFSGGNNLAIRDAIEKEFEYVLLLNNDTTVENGFLDYMVKTAEANDNIGIVAGKIYFYYNREKVWSAGGEYDRNTGLTEQYSGVDCDMFDKEKNITFATGCLMLIPVKVINRVGLLEEGYFLYSEDSDYCQRVLDAGYNLTYTPKAIIYHKVSASTGDRSPLQQRYMMRNNLYMIKRYSTKRFHSYLCMSWQMIKHILRGRRNLVPTIKGYVDFALHRTGKI